MSEINYGHQDRVQMYGTRAATPRSRMTETRSPLSSDTMSGRGLQPMPWKGSGLSGTTRCRCGRNGLARPTAHLRYWRRAVRLIPSASSRLYLFMASPIAMSARHSFDSRPSGCLSMFDIHFDVGSTQTLPYAASRLNVCLFGVSLTPPAALCVRNRCNLFACTPEKRCVQSDRPGRQDATRALRKVPLQF